MKPHPDEPALTADRLRVLYEDNHLIAVYKPAGLLTQGDASGHASLLDVVRAWLADRYSKPGNVYLGLLHRLDRPVSGVVLLAKTSKGASRLSEQFRQRTVNKLYLARVAGVLHPPQGRLEHGHRHREGSRNVEIADISAAPGSGFKSASLFYETRWIDHTENESVLEVRLETGRKHQIRSQLAHVRHPIVGDSLYGGRDRGRAGVIELCAVRLSVMHPVTRAPLTIDLPPALIPARLREA